MGYSGQYGSFGGQGAMWDKPQYSAPSYTRYPIQPAPATTCAAPTTTTYNEAAYNVNNDITVNNEGVFL